jgi:hypothetical protein
MKPVLKYSAIALLALATCVPAASARGFGGGFRGGFYGGPAFYGGVGFYPGYYGYYGPWYGPGYYAPNAGQVEIKTKQKGNQVFVDGGYAGRTGELKSFPLRAGTHTIELRNAHGQTFYQERITVIAGKKIKIQSDYAG